jgi:hypothetical protein
MMQLNNLQSRFPLDNIIVDVVYFIGSQNFEHDIDLIIVSEDFEGLSRIKRTEKIALNFENLAVDLTCMTRREFDRLNTQGSFFLQKVLPSAIIVYDRKSH